MVQPDDRQGRKRRPSARPQPARQPARKEQATNVPPRKQKNEALVLKHYRLRAADVSQTEAIASQRQTESNDIVRRQYERGVLVDSALGAPGDDGLYGRYTGERLAQLLRPDIDGLISFALAHGEIPTIIQEYRAIIQQVRSQIAQMPAGHHITTSPHESASLGSQAHTAATEVADEAADVYDMFFHPTPLEPEQPEQEKRGPSP